MMNPPDFPPPKKPRRSRAELKELMLATGLEVLGQRDAPAGHDTLTYKAVFDRLADEHGIRVTHASVHERIWPTQRAFQLDVLRRMAEQLPAETFLSESGAAATVVRDADLSRPDGQRRATREMIRVSCNADMAEPDITLSVYRSIRMVLLKLSKSDPDYDSLAAAIEDTRRDLSARYAALFGQLVEALNLRVQPQLGVSLDDALHLLFTQVVALADGYGIEPDRAAMFKLPTGPDGQLQEWHRYSWSIWAAACALLELDGDLPDSERLLSAVS